MKPITHISSLLALAAVAGAASPAGASAQAVPPPTPFVVQPIIATGAAAKVSIGNRTIAWAIHDEPGGSNAAGTTVWTLRDGKPVVAAKLPSLDSERLEAGTDASGDPVAIVSDGPQEGKPTSFYLARLDTGQVRRLALGRDARSVEDVAVDAGRVLYSTSARGHTKRARSSLWTARLDGRALTTPRRLRRSRLGVTFETVRADRRRIAVTGSRAARVGGEDQENLPLYAGTARGAWRKIGKDGSSSSGGVFRVNAAGFSPSRRSVIATTTGSYNFSVERVFLLSGRTRRLKIPGTARAETFDMDAAYDPVTDRLLLSSYDDSSGGFQIGWSGVLGS